MRPLHLLDEQDTCAPAQGLELLAEDEAVARAEVFKALGDPTRLRLLHHIAQADGGTVCSCHLPGALGISQPTMSHHLKKLAEAGLVVREQRGRWAHYTVNRETLERACRALDPTRPGPSPVVPAGSGQAGPAQAASRTTGTASPDRTASS